MRRAFSTIQLPPVPETQFTCRLEACWSTRSRHHQDTGSTSDGASRSSSARGRRTWIFLTDAKLESSEASLPTSSRAQDVLVFALLVTCAVRRQSGRHRARSARTARSEQRPPCRAPPVASPTPIVSSPKKDAISARQAHIAHRVPLGQSCATLDDLARSPGRRVANAPARVCLGITVRQAARATHRALALPGASTTRTEAPVWPPALSVQSGPVPHLQGALEQLSALPGNISPTRVRVPAFHAQ
mmetsp:Transcript_15136/g.40673  ORF Transcript_15136/g.40673 Transcript_15136/m.40673 type:complete len:245 (+) Transcript_15136:948-1682(+)